MLRVESKRRARALQLLYAMETTGESADSVAGGLARLVGPEPQLMDEAQSLVDGVLAHRAELERLTQAAADNWRIERMAIVERSILLIATHELLLGVLSAKVVIDEAVWLAQRFAGPKAPPFINGVLDRVARDLGRL